MCLLWLLTWIAELEKGGKFRESKSEEGVQNIPLERPKTAEKPIEAG